IKRLLAYSSIGHVGYILIGIATLNFDGCKAILIYLVLYASMSIGSFACILLMKRGGKEVEDITAFSGLAETNPFLAICISSLMLSMAGIPPLAGFFAKFYIFLAA